MSTSDADKPTTSYERWWNRTRQDDDADSTFTWGEEVWKAAREDFRRSQLKRRKSKEVKR